MLGFERRMVAALTTVSDASLRGGVAAWVDATLSDMPEVIRLGVTVETLGLGLWARARARVRGIDDDELIRSFEASPLWPVRQYVRLLRGLVIFAEQELAAPVGAST